jgi:MFS family permease
VLRNRPWLKTLLVAVLIGAFGVLALAPNWKHPFQIFSLRPVIFLLLGLGALGLAWAIVLRRLNFSRWRQEDRDLAVIGLVFSVAVFGGIQLVSAGQSLADSSYQSNASQIIALWALAYFAAGFLVGFLFGIPRVLQSDAGSRKQDAQQLLEYTQRVNTNLEQISDWLTKIIVGLGLVQLKRVPDYLYQAATWMARSFMPKDGKGLQEAASFSSSVIVFFLIVGFLSGYLITRIYLPGVFRRSEAFPEQTQLSGISKDETTNKLRSFWKPDGTKVDVDHEKQLLDWMTKSGLSSPDKKVDLASFLVAPEYAREREQALKELNPQ